ncbi:hypothetical protein COOONC_25952 [Cooperia oncophora]
MAPTMIANCDGLKTGTGCFDINVTEVLTSFWPSVDGNLPLDEPLCGYRCVMTHDFSDVFEKYQR